MVDHCRLHLESEGSVMLLGLRLELAFLLGDALMSRVVYSSVQDVSARSFRAIGWSRYIQGKPDDVRPSQIF